MSGDREPDLPARREPELDTPALDTPAMEAGAAAPDAAEPGERSRIGPYRLVRRLGEGGMGVVWLAEQEAPVRRKVAVKVIKRGMDTRQVIARFQAERQALAMMDHPTIAHVLDAGQTPRGRPYFVMEYVRGVPITEYCDRHRLNLRRRLLLFHQVCQGVQHAHQKAVIHRDLKPSNILVTEHQGRAVPKIIDFGVAKATAQRLTDTSFHTELGQMIGTPEFMSPEQAELTGEDVDTRTDVYSLGVVLYTLLAGALPFDSEALRKEGPEELRRRIRDQEPPPPSGRLKSLPDAADVAALRGSEPRILARQLGGDLDWIVLKALEKDRNRRYGSPRELAADLERYLDHEPVEARPPSGIYRMTKFARRHRGGVAVAAVALVLLVGFAAAMALQARSLARERDRKEAALAEAEAVTRFLSDMLRAVDPRLSGGDVQARDLLDAASDELGSTLEDQPTVEARVRMAVGRGYDALGLYEAAEETIRTAYAVRRSLLGPDHPDTLDSLAGLAQVLYGQGRYREAGELYRRAVEGRSRVLGEEHLHTRWTRQNLAANHLAQGNLQEAEALLAAALETAGEVVGGDAGEVEEQILAITTNLAALYHQQERYAEAEELYRRSLEMQERSLGPRHADTLMTRGNLGELLADRGEAERAEQILVEVLRDKRAVFGDDHPRTWYTMGVLARLYAGQGSPEKAEPLLVEAWEDRVRTLGAEHPDTLRARDALDERRAAGEAPGP